MRFGCRKGCGTSAMPGVWWARCVRCRRRYWGHWYLVMLEARQYRVWCGWLGLRRRWKRGCGVFPTGGWGVCCVVALISSRELRRLYGVVCGGVVANVPPPRFVGEIAAAG